MAQGATAQRSKQVAMKTLGLLDLSDVELATEPSHASVWNIIQKLSFEVESAPFTPALKHYSYVFKLQLGLASRRQSPPSVSADSRLRPNLTSWLFRWLSAEQPGAKASSCTISVNSMAPLHTDDMNIGQTYLTTLGQFTGGCLWHASEDPEGIALDATNKFVAFTSYGPHCTMPYVGSRVFIAFYTHGSIQRASGDLRAELQQLCVPLPSPDEAMEMKGIRVAMTSPLKIRLERAKTWLANHKQSHPELWQQPAVAHISHVWFCKWCHAWGVQSSGQPRIYCSDAHRKKHERKNSVMKVLKKKPMAKRPACRGRR